jgi:hypothetical protein
MSYFIVTTSKFYRECVAHLTYGASQSNWLCNINEDDIIFLSQFNYKSQDLFGPFRVTNSLFYDKSIIYPEQKYFYRIKFEPIDQIKHIEETDLYLYGIESKSADYYFKIINLLQQNKHLHSISLTDDEGDAILNVFKATDSELNFNHEVENVQHNILSIDRRYIWIKNKLNKNISFSSESDLETYILMSLKGIKNIEYKCMNKLLEKFSENNLLDSKIYNQFVFGNAYPADIVIINEKNINVFELKKDCLVFSNIQQIKKEIKKHLFYSISSNRLSKQHNPERFNFYLLTLGHKNNKPIEYIIKENYCNLCNKLSANRENTLTFVEYRTNGFELTFEEAF